MIKKLRNFLQRKSYITALRELSLYFLFLLWAAYYLYFSIIQHSQNIIFMLSVIDEELKAPGCSTEVEMSVLVLSVNEEVCV